MVVAEKALRFFLGCMSVSYAIWNVNSLPKNKIVIDNDIYVLFILYLKFKYETESFIPRPCPRYLCPRFFKWSVAICF